ncbi:uncharacterized protein LOC122510914 [Leptopilina heterotoma]|uniref:uncharacterized protein LOC122510914 n=1 Tax=Leptopilina heterotoma TaxID=63436 RepID=UPI001CA91F5A|nr:uncharacterized protein LOC122510914 [Leptopilina heterotoma]
MYSVNPRQLELFHLRLLLLTVKGVTSFQSLRTVNGVIHESFTSACLALGLIEDDSEWIRTMEEATLWMMPRSLRQLFVRILIHCHPVHPEKLWEQFKGQMSEDYSRIGNIEAEKTAYRNIKSMLLNEGYCLTDFQGLLDTDENFSEQVDEIGIAATLLPNGKTVHKVLGLPVPLYSDSSSNIKVQSKEALFLKNIDVFIWDEAPMAPKYALEVMDKLLRDIMKSNKVFENMRALPEETEFVDFLLKVGNGELNDTDDNVELPEHIIQQGNIDIAEEMYGHLIQQKKFKDLSMCAILAPRNVDVDDINKRVVNLLDSKEILVLMKDYVTEQG